MQGETSPSLQCGMTWQNSLTKKRFRSYHPQSSLLLAVAELTNKEVCLTIKDVKLLLRNKIVIPQCAMTDIQLAATPATHYYINSRAPEAEYIYTVLRARKNEEQTDFGQAATAKPHKLQVSMRIKAGSMHHVANVAKLQLNKMAPTPVKTMKNKTNDLEFHYAPSKGKEAGEFIVDDILDIQPAVETQTTGTPSSASAPAIKSMETRKEASKAKGESEFIADDVLDIKPAVQIQTTRTPSSTYVPAPESMEERQETTKGKEKSSAEEGTPPTNYSTVVEHPKKWEGTDTTQVKSAKRALFKQQSAEPKKRTGD
ncbi:hypothetical protein Tco_1247185 [Tanacetum coccineum]